MGATQELFYEQPLASGSVLHGELRALPPGEAWAWEAPLSNGGRIRLRPGARRRMESSYLRPAAEAWCRPVTAARQRPEGLHG